MDELIEIVKNTFKDVEVNQECFVNEEKNKIIFYFFNRKLFISIPTVTLNHIPAEAVLDLIWGHIKKYVWRKKDDI